MTGIETLMAHRIDARQEGDYKELAIVTRDEAPRYVVMAEELISAIKLLILNWQLNRQHSFPPPP